MNGIWSARIAQTVILLAIAIGWLFGSALLMLIGCCLGIASVARDFAKQCEKPWFAVLFGLVVPCGVSLLWGAANALGSMRIRDMFPQLSPVDLGDALNVLSIAYTISFGIGTLALAIDTMGAWAVFSCFKHRREDRARLLTNPFVRAASICVLGYWVTNVALWSLDYAIVKDAERVAGIAKERDLHHAVSGSDAVKDARIGGDSLIDLAIMYQMRSPSSACTGLDADDRVSVLPGGRAMVSPAVTYRTEWTSETVHPIANIYFMDCSPAKR
jgi:hypothetical protein